MANRDYYEILGVTPDADGAAVHRTYWQLARKYQAQAPGDPRAHGLLDGLNEAYNVLGTPHLRQEYDATYRPAAASKPTQAAAPNRGAPAGGIRGMMPWGRKRSEGAPVAQVRAANGTAEKARQVPIDDLQRSTASIVGRWRKSAAPDVLRRTQSPDTTLVDIFQTERNLDEPAEPLTAVLDVLRGSREPVSPR